MSGGITCCPLDDDDLDQWAQEFIVRGAYMGHQAWAKKLLEGQRQRIKDLIAWDVPIIREESGEIRRVLSRGMVNVRTCQWRPKAAITELRKQIEARLVLVRTQSRLEANARQPRRDSRVPRALL